MRWKTPVLGGATVLGVVIGFGEYWFKVCTELSGQVYVSIVLGAAVGADSTEECLSAVAGMGLGAAVGNNCTDGCLEAVL